MISYESNRQTAVCTTCGRSDDSPYRVYDAHGKVIIGCVDDCHTGRLVAISESNRWHRRPEAKRIRAIAKRVQQGKGYGPKTSQDVSRKTMKAPLHCLSRAGKGPAHIVKCKRRESKEDARGRVRERTVTVWCIVECGELRSEWDRKRDAVVALERMAS